MIENEKRDEN